MKLPKFDNKHNTKLKNYLNRFLRFLSAGFSVTYIESVNYILGTFGIFCIISGVLMLFRGYFTVKIFNIDILDNSFQEMINFVNEGTWFVRFLHTNGLSIIFIILYLYIFKALTLRTYTTKLGYSDWVAVVTVLSMFLYLSIFDFRIDVCVSYWGIWDWLGPGYRWKLDLIVNLQNFFYYVERFSKIHFSAPFLCLFLFLHISRFGAKKNISSNTEFSKMHREIHYYRVFFKWLYTFIFYSILIYFNWHSDFLGHNQCLYEHYMDIEDMNNVNFKPSNPEWYHMPFVFIASFIPKNLQFWVFTSTYFALILFPKLNKSNIWSPRRLIVHKVISISLVIVFILSGYIGLTTLSTLVWNWTILHKSVGYICIFLFFFIIFIILPAVFLLENFIISAAKIEKNPKKDEK